jgi:hypothetical protein
MNQMKFYEFLMFDDAEQWMGCKFSFEVFQIGKGREELIDSFVGNIVRGHDAGRRFSAGGNSAEGQERLELQPSDDSGFDGFVRSGTHGSADGGAQMKGHLRQIPFAQLLVATAQKLDFRRCGVGVGEV